MKIAIMQPYFLPYIGYFQLINAVDEFVIYDNIKYTKKGWINRNRFLQNGKDALFSIPLKKDSDFLDVRDREISDTYERQRLLDQIKHAYCKAPQFQECFPAVRDIINYEEKGLFPYILNSVKKTCEYLGITSKITVSSDIGIDHTNLRSQDKVLAICAALNAREYINPIGGVELYDKTVFKGKGIGLSFLRTANVEYKQFDNDFVPSLSIIDVMMFNPKPQASNYLKMYTLE